MNKAKTEPPAVIDVNISIGRGGGFSAISGAKMVAILAKKLQKPRAVAQKSVGNTSTVDTYTITKPLEIPNLAKVTKMGISCGLFVPQNKISSPPIAEMIKETEKASRIPIFFSRTPPRM